MNTFTALTLFEFVPIDILGEVETISRNNKYFLVISHCFSKLVRVVLHRAVTVECVAKANVIHWLMAYGPPRILFLENGK